MAKSLIGQLTEPFRPEQFHDSYRENVGRLIEQKKKGQKITAVKQPRKAPVIDLMDALKRSLKLTAPAAKSSGSSGRSRPVGKKIAKRGKAA